MLTYVFHKISGVPESHIIGSGTILDTSRLQSTLAKRFCISPKNVHAHVYGEHGDSSFVPWSLVHIANNHIDSYKAHSPDHDRIKWNQDYEEIEQFVKTSGAQVIKNKGATFYAVAMSVCHLCKCVQSTAGTALTVSTMMHGEYGVSDVCLSTLALVDNQGVRGKILNQLTDGEIDKLRASAEKAEGRHPPGRDLNTKFIINKEENALMEYRMEHDSMGEVRVPADKYWGAQTERSHNNFPIGVGIETMPAEIVHAFGILKKAAARPTALCARKR